MEFWLNALDLFHTSVWQRAHRQCLERFTVCDQSFYFGSKLGGKHPPANFLFGRPDSSLSSQSTDQKQETPVDQLMVSVTALTPSWRLAPLPSFLSAGRTRCFAVNMHYSCRGQIHLQIPQRFTPKHCEWRQEAGQPSWLLSSTNCGDTVPLVPPVFDKPAWLPWKRSARHIASWQGVCRFDDPI